MTEEKLGGKWETGNGKGHCSIARKISQVLIYLGGKKKMAKKSQYQHKLQYNNNYNRTNYRSFSVRFSINSEEDIIRWLEKKSGVKSYISDLITADMKKSKGTKSTVKAPKKPIAKKPTAKKKK